jgi:hypothetical protein
MMTTSDVLMTDVPATAVRVGAEDAIAAAPAPAGRKLPVPPPRQMSAASPAHAVAAVQLVRLEEDGRLAVSAEAAALLRGLAGAVAAVAVVGPARTGKSELLNWLAAAEPAPPPPPEVFAAGDGSIRTRGMWLWPGAAAAPGAARLLWLDCQGIDDPAGAGLGLLALAALLASVLLCAGACCACWPCSL